MNPRVSIITVNFNGARFLRAFFESVRDSQYGNVETIFVDNASSDVSVDYVRKNWPNVRIIENKENLGFSAANNIAADIANGEYLFFLNNDTKICPDTIQLLVKNMSMDARLGICGCKMASYDGKIIFHSGIGVDIFGFPAAHGKTFYAEGSALMIKREIFKKADGFDPEYFMFHEDIDLAWKVWLLGYRVEANSKAIVYHSVGASAGGTALLKEGQYKSTYFRRYLSERNNIRTLLKNFGFPALILVLFTYFLLNLIEIGFFFILLKPKVAFCYLRAYLWNIRHFKDTLSCRKKVQHTRKISDIEIMSKMNKMIGKLEVFKIVKIPRFE